MSSPSPADVAAILPLLVEGTSLLIMRSGPDSIWADFRVDHYSVSLRTVDDGLRLGQDCTADSWGAAFAHAAAKSQGEFAQFREFCMSMTKALGWPS